MAVTGSVDDGTSTQEPAADAGERNGNMIGAVDNVLRLLLLFENQKLLRVNEVSRQMQLSRSTVHRMLTTLSHHGFVVQDSFSRGYGPGPALVDIGLAVVNEMDIRQIARSTLETLRSATNETVHLAVLRDLDVLYLDGLESERLVRAGQRIGQSLPAYATAAGKALLAQMDDDAVKTLYPSATLGRVTDQSLRTRAALLRALAQVREQGYAVNHGESEDDVSGLAVAVPDRRGRPRAALVVTGPRSRVDAAWIDGVATAATEASHSLRSLLD